MTAAAWPTSWTTEICGFSGIEFFRASSAAGCSIKPQHEREGEKTSLEEEIRRQRARNLRYKKAALLTLNVDSIQTWIREAYELCAEWEYTSEEARDALMDALDGDDEEYQAYQMSFAALWVDLERFQNDLQEPIGLYAADYFDDVMVGMVGLDGKSDMVGYDAFDGDYYGLDSWEEEAAGKEARKRIERMKKQEIVEKAGTCMRIALSYMALSYRLDALGAAVDILRGINGDILKDINALNEQYENMTKNPYDRKAERKFDALAKMLPSEVWLR